MFRSILNLLGCANNTAPANEPAPDPPTWEDVAQDTLTKAYGGIGAGWANDIPNARAEYVHAIPTEGHIVYVTSGVHKARFPHEFVLRVRWDPPPPIEDVWEVVPMWPVVMLAELARVEDTLPQPLAPGNHIRKVIIKDGGPYRHFAFLSDPVLKPQYLGGQPQPLVFIQVVPITDAQLEEIDKIPTGAKNTVLENWAREDPLMLVGATAE